MEAESEGKEDNACSRSDSDNLRYGQQVVYTYVFPYSTVEPKRKECRHFYDDYPQDWIFEKQ